MNEQISLIVYDFDGTLVDTLDDIAFSVNFALKKLGQRPLNREDIQTCVGRGVFMLMERALNGTAWDDIDQAVAIFREHYANHLTDRSDFYPHCRETLDFFSDRKQAICSNKTEAFVRKILEHLDGLSPFESIIGGDSLRTQKPDPEGIHHLLSKYGLSADEALFVGDSALDIETGKNAKVRTCAVTYGMGDSLAMQALQPDWTINNLSELKHLVD